MSVATDNVRVKPLEQAEAIKRHEEQIINNIWVQFHLLCAFETCTLESMRAIDLHNLHDGDETQFAQQQTFENPRTKKTEQQM